MDSQNQLYALLEDPVDFPRNLIRHNSYEYTLASYHERLDGQEDRLFQKEKNVAVDFSELDFHGKGTMDAFDIAGLNIETRY